MEPPDTYLWADVFEEVFNLLRLGLTLEGAFGYVATDIGADPLYIAKAMAHCRRCQEKAAKEFPEYSIQLARYL